VPLNHSARICKNTGADGRAVLIETKVKFSDHAKASISSFIAFILNKLDSITSFLLEDCVTFGRVYSHASVFIEGRVTSLDIVKTRDITSTASITCRVLINC
jgi:hypothetical protein